jgi:hypothetical protein
MYQIPSTASDLRDGLTFRLLHDRRRDLGIKSTSRFSIGGFLVAIRIQEIGATSNEPDLREDQPTSSRANSPSRDLQRSPIPVRVVDQ